MKKTKFEKFLYNRGLLKTFERNLKSDAFERDLKKKNINSYIKYNGDSIEAIDDAFNWNDSPEGYNFWYDVDGDWRDSMMNRTL